VVVSSPVTTLPSITRCSPHSPAHTKKNEYLFPPPPPPAIPNPYHLFYVLLAVRNSLVDTGPYLLYIPKSFYSMKQEINYNGQWRENTTFTVFKLTQSVLYMPITSVILSLFQVNFIFIHESALGVGVAQSV
jgi:hypothetical protein